MKINFNYSFDVGNKLLVKHESVKEFLSITNSQIANELLAIHKEL